MFKLLDWTINADSVEKTYAWGKSVIRTSVPAEAFTFQDIADILQILELSQSSMDQEGKDFVKSLKDKIAKKAKK